MKKTQEIKFAIVGCGHIAQRHARYASEAGSLVAVCDVDGEKADDLAGRYSAHAYYDIDDLLAVEESVDVVSICTPNGLHAAHAIKASQAGNDVLCEKPMALTVKDCRAMIDEAKKAQRQLWVVKQNRFNPPVQAVKHLINEGRLGEILGVQVNCFWNRNKEYYEQSDWRGTEDLDGGALFTQFSHFIDLMYWLVGDVARSRAYVDNRCHPQIEIDDQGVVLMKFDNGATGTLHYTNNSYSKNMEGSITLFGERGTVKIGGQYLNTLEYQSIDGAPPPQDFEERRANDYGTYKGSMSNHDKVYANIVDVLHSSATIMASARDGMKTIEIITEIYRSAVHS